MQAFHLETVDSTNEAVKRLIRSGELCEAAYLLAREQTAGKGSRGKKWLSPKDAGIYLTVVELPKDQAEPQALACANPVKPGLPGARVEPAARAMDIGTFTLAAGVACVEALKETAGIEVQLKPINDLYVNGCKLGGILTEATFKNGSVEAVITGLGINVRHVDRALPADAVAPISLEELLPSARFERLDLDALVATLVVKIRAWNAVVLTGRIEHVNGAWERHKLSGLTLRKASADNAPRGTQRTRRGE